MSKLDQKNLKLKVSANSFGRVAENRSKLEAWVQYSKDKNLLYLIYTVQAGIVNFCSMQKATYFKKSVSFRPSGPPLMVCGVAC